MKNDSTFALTLSFPPQSPLFIEVTAIRDPMVAT